jgi:hypothetical protein
MRLVWNITSGKIKRVLIRVDQPRKDDGTTIRIVTAAGAREVELPPKSTCIIADGTTSVEEVEQLIGRPVQLVTPEGEPYRKHPIYQIPVDISKGTKPERFVPTLESVIGLLPAHYRIGLIADKKHLPALRGTANDGPVIREGLGQRIVKSAHFRGGETSGMNCWNKECDVLIVFGEPRVNPASVKTRLFQLGYREAVSIKPTWVTDYFSAPTHDGRRLTVRTKGYLNRALRKAYNSLVKKELVQCVGRARSCCDDGIPSIVVATENLGYPVIDRKILQLTDVEK